MSYLTKATIQDAVTHRQESAGLRRLYPQPIWGLRRGWQESPHLQSRMPSGRGCNGGGMRLVALDSLTLSGLAGIDEALPPLAGGVLFRRVIWPGTARTPERSTQAAAGLAGAQHS